MTLKTFDAPNQDVVPDIEKIPCPPKKWHNKYKSNCEQHIYEYDKFVGPGDIIDAPDKWPSKDIAETKHHWAVANIPNHIIALGNGVWLGAFPAED